MEEQQDIVNLGGGIQLIGFSQVDGGKMVVVKKMVGSYVREISEKIQFENLSLELKAESQYEIEAKLTAGGETTSSDATEQNIFMAIDSVLKKLG